MNKMKKNCSMTGEILHMSEELDAVETLKEDRRGVTPGTDTLREMMRVYGGGRYIPGDDTCVDHKNDFMNPDQTRLTNPSNYYLKIK